MYISPQFLYKSYRTIHHFTPFFPTEQYILGTVSFPCINRESSPILFTSCTGSHRVKEPWFIYPSPTYRLFPIFYCYSLLLMYKHIYKIHFQKGIAESKSIHIFTFEKDCHIAFHNDCFILQSYQQCTRVPTFPYAHQHLLFSGIFK